ncbi:MAG: glycosyltransferase family 4 protein [Planctomycetes bacterium]|nr:glycosyltransferase family 4 protein [Planctomycetota bacterium]
MKLKIVGDASDLAPHHKSPGRQRLTVLFHTSPVAFHNPGGGEVQLLKTAQYLRGLGADVRLLDPWNDRLDQADWLHLFGTLPECLTMARLAKRVGVRVALSPISWYDPLVSWRLESGAVRKLRAVTGWLARRLCPRLPSWRRELIQCADLLLPNSQAEARQLKQLFQADPCRIVVVPNGVDARFAHADPELFPTLFGVRGFVLLTGRLEPRKNQLAVIRALRGTNVPLVVIGDPHLDHTDYYDQCFQEAGAGVRFVGRLEPDSPLLASAYAAARVVVLASWFETPGLTALEGAAAGAHVVVTERGSAREYFGQAARYVAPNDVAGIRRAICEAVATPRDGELRERVLRQYRWEAVAAQTLAAYQRRMAARISLRIKPLAAAA